LIVSATGQGCLNGETGCSDPNGYSLNWCGPINCGALIAKIGPSGTPFFVGAQFKGTMREPGDLYLAYNDINWVDNTGGYQVTVRIENPQRAGSASAQGAPGRSSGPRVVKSPLVENRQSEPGEPTFKALEQSLKFSWEVTNQTRLPLYLSFKAWSDFGVEVPINTTINFFLSKGDYDVEVSPTLPDGGYVGLNLKWSVQNGLRYRSTFTWSQTAPPPAGGTSGDLQTTPQATVLSGPDTARQEIDNIRRSPHQTMPSAQASPFALGGQTDMIFENGTDYTLYVYLAGPVTQQAQISARGSQTLRLSPGAYEVAAKVSDPGVAPFYGTQTCMANTQYTNHFYVATSTH